MFEEIVIRFMIGGLIVSLFAATGDMFRPKSFAGIFGAAPSVALATLGLAFFKDGGGHAAVEGRSMLLGAVALVAYSLLVGRVLLRRRGTAPVSGMVAAGGAWVAWLGVALGLYAVIFR